MSILEYLIFVFLILNTSILFLPKGIDLLSKNLFSRSPSKIAWFIVWIISAIVYLSLLIGIYYYLKEQINDTTIISDYV